MVNGIDTQEDAPVAATDVLERHAVDPAATPYAVFVGASRVAELQRTRAAVVWISDMLESDVIPRLSSTGRPADGVLCRTTSATPPPSGLPQPSPPVLDDPARAARLGTAGRERAVAEFGWDAVARQMKDVYAHVLR
jgi:hypothetical protein